MSGAARARASSPRPRSRSPGCSRCCARRSTGSTTSRRRRPRRCAARSALAPGVERDRFLIGAATLSLLARLRRARAACWWRSTTRTGSTSRRSRAVLFAARRLLADARRALLIAARPRHPGDRTRCRRSSSRAGPRDRRARCSSTTPAGRCRPAPPTASSRRRSATRWRSSSCAAAARRAAERTLPDRDERRARLRAPDRALPGPARRALALAAAEDAGDLAVLDRAATALGLDLGDARRRPSAPASSSIALDRSAFCHPLARSAAYRSAAPDERRAAHARARRRAPSRTPTGGRGTSPRRRSGPTPTPREALEAAGRRARARSAYAAAASSFERAARLTAALPERARRLFAAAEAAWLAGHAERAERLLEEARERLPTTPRCGSRSTTCAATPRCAPGRVDGRPRHPRRGGRAGRAATRRAVVMLAEAADACLYAARPEPMLRAAQRAWDALAPDAGERERFFADARARDGADLQRPRRGGRRARCATPIEILERSDALSGDPRLLSSAALGAAVAARGAPRAARSWRARSSRRAARARSARCRSRCGSPARDAATSDRCGGRRGALRGGDPARARDRAGDRRCAPALAGLACVRGAPGPRGGVPRARRARRSRWPSELGLGFFRLWALDALAELELGLGGRRGRRRRTWRRRSGCSAERGIADPDVVAGARAGRGAAAARPRRRGRAAARATSRGGARPRASRGRSPGWRAAAACCGDAATASRRR